MQSAVLPALRLSFDAVFYYVRDIDQSIEFYRHTLGVKLVSHDFVARFDVDDVLFELVPSPHGQPISGTGNARLCLQVNDIRETVRQLNERAVETGEVKPEPGVAGKNLAERVGFEHFRGVENKGKSLESIAGFAQILNFRRRLAHELAQEMF